jgi:hypothetical protein
MGFLIEWMAGFFVMALAGEATARDNEVLAPIDPPA